MAGEISYRERIADGHVSWMKSWWKGIFLWKHIPALVFNDTTEMLAARNIKVVKNIAHDSGQAEKKKKRELRFDLFPEGGNLLPGYLPVWPLRQRTATVIR